jgi:FdhE protein
LGAVENSIAAELACLDNWPMAVSSSPWQRRIGRAQELASQHPFATEILGFYIHVASFQEDLHRRLRAVRQSPAGSIDRELSGAELSELSSRFESFLSLAGAHGPPQLSKLSCGSQARGPSFWAELLNAAWTTHGRSDAQGLLALAFLQPYAELLRARASVDPVQRTYAVCPFCSRKPGLGVLRPQGDGAARSLVCSFCLNEWEFRRIVCPGCGEENDQKLSVFTASDFDYIRVECCDACKTYIKTVDLARNGRAEPVVDELASVPLDLWARDRGYAKLQNNLLGM